jgi:uncharacterized protein (DUF849 family)
MTVIDTPVIIEAAINGINPRAPRLPEDIARDALAAFEAGASVVHNHIDLATGAPEAIAERYLEAWRPVLAARPDALLYPTVGFAPGDVVASFAHIEHLTAAANMRIGLVDPGSVNLGGCDDEGVPVGGTAYTNTFDSIRHQMGLCERLALGPSLAIYEPGFLRATLAWHRAGRLPAGAMVKFYFGGPYGYLGRSEAGPSFGLMPTRKGLDAYVEMLEGTGLPWSVAVMGGDLFATPVARYALELGGHLHLGLEDHSGAGLREVTNAELVGEAVALAKEVGRPVATCDRAAEILGLRPR